MKETSNLSGLARFSSIKIFIAFILITVSGCTRYATKEEVNELNQLKASVYELEKEVKELKEKQIELVNYRSRLLKELKECQQSKILKDSVNNY
jgi:flagellar hook-associated protein FlgK